MLVRDVMSRNPVTTSPDTSVPDALDIMKRNQVRRLPVVKDGALVGIVTQMDLLRASPSPVTSLAVWEIPHLVAKIKVREVMSTDPITIEPERPIEDAALLMRDKNIGGLPVVEKGKVVGIITETDIFDAFVNALGVRRGGTRVTVEVEDRVGALAEMTALIKELELDIISLVTMPIEGGRAKAVCRVKGRKVGELADRLNAHGYKILHLFPEQGSR